MSDTVVAVHPVPVLVTTGRGPAAWRLVSARTEVTIPRVDEAEVRSVGLAPPWSREAGSARGHLVEIGGRLFAEVGERWHGKPGEGIADALAGPGAYRRNDSVASLLLARTPASAVMPELDGAFRRLNDIHADARGGGLPRGRSVRVEEDCTDMARAALSRFVEGNVRLAGGKGYVNAGGPLVAACPVTGVYEVSLAPAWGYTASSARLRVGEVLAFSEAIGMPRPRVESGSIPAGLAPEGDGDLMLLNAVAAEMLKIVGRYVPRTSLNDAIVPEAAAGSFEALARPAWLGACGLLGEDDLVPVLRLVSEAIRSFKAMRSPQGVAYHVGNNRVGHVERDVDLWALPRALAREARFDEQDVPFLPGPAA